MKHIVNATTKEVKEIDLTTDELTIRTAEEQTYVNSAPERLKEQKKAELHGSDISEVPRIAEDVLDVLVSKGVITLTDLPQASQDKIAARKALRAEL